MIYSQTQWILMFYIYCLIGWIWECCYVSVQKRKWINRGFLYGPWLPIYGSGAIIILFTTLPVSSDNLLVFLVGMLSATVLEYVTGAVMERLFHMRYWDYSNLPCNVNGHICFGVSIGWGIFSVILIRFIHPPVERFVLAVSGEIADAVSLGLTVLFTVDVTKSVQNALDLKKLMEKLTSSSEVVERMEECFHTLTEKMNSNSNRLREYMQEIERSLAEQRERRTKLLASIHAKSAEALKEAELQLQSAKSFQEREYTEKIRSALVELQTAVQKHETALADRKDRAVRRAISILERNPSANSRTHPKGFSELLDLKNEKSRERKKKDKKTNKSQKE